jgi:hypothetical protein
MLAEFAELIQKASIAAEETNDTVLEYFHLGGKIHVTVSSRFQTVDLRLFYYPSNEESLKPGRPGVALKFAEWKKLFEVLPDINEKLNIDEVQPCYMSHTNILQSLSCEECNV